MFLILNIIILVFCITNICTLKTIISTMNLNSSQDVLLSYLCLCFFVILVDYFFMRNVYYVRHRVQQQTSTIEYVVIIRVGTQLYTKIILITHTLL